MSEEVTIPEEHNEHYKIVLEQTKKSGNNTAEKRIPELYWILRNEEGKSPLDAKDQVKQDLIDTFSRVTMDKHFPDEAKDEEKQRAAKIRWERKQQRDKEKSASSADAETDSDKQTEKESESLPPITVAIGGTQEPEKRATSESYQEYESHEEEKTSFEPKEDEEPTPLELANIRIAQLEDALHKISDKQFVTATQLETKTEVPVETSKSLNDEEVFEYLRGRSTETGKIIFIDRVGSGALVQSLSQYKTAFKVAELFLRVIE